MQGQGSAKGKRKHPGIESRHSRICETRAGGDCKCKPTYRAWVYDRRTGEKLRKTFDRLDDAKAWRADATVGLRKGTMRSPSRITLNEAADSWLEGVKAGTIRNRSGDVYKPSAIRGYESALTRKIRPALGAHRLSEIRRVDIQDLADRMLADGDDPSTIRNALMPLRAIYRRATARGDVGVNPTLAIELPAVRGRRDRVASPEEAAKLIEAAPPQDRALWAAALYAGLRRGELMALRWEDIDLAAGVIRVERSWDVREGAIEPKSRAGKRTVPIAVVLRDHLVEHKMQTGRETGLVFGRSTTTPFEPVSLGARASKAWGAANLAGITLHEGRHTFASLMIAAGVNAKALSSYMGHASVTITYDRYGHLMPGNEDEAAALLDAYLTRADTRARTAQLD